MATSNLPAAYWPHRFPEVFNDNLTCVCGARFKDVGRALDHLDAIYGPPTRTGKGR